MNLNKISSTEWLTFFGFTIALATLLLIGAMSMQFLKETRIDDRLVEHTHGVIERLQSCLLAEKDMETHARAFVLTGADSNLEIYKSASAALARSVSSVAYLTADNPLRQRQLQALRPLLDERLAAAARLITTRQTMGQQAAIAILFEHKILRIINEIHFVLDEMQLEERRLLAVRLQEHAKSSIKLRMIILLGSTMAILFVSLSSILIHRDLRARQRAESELRENQQQLQRQVEELQAANKELEAFSYSVSHDLRAPLRGIEGFSQVLRETYKDRLDAEGQAYFERISAAAKRMGILIDEILELSRITRRPLQREDVDLAALTRDIVEDLKKSDPARNVQWSIPEALHVQGDRVLLTVALTNLLSNAWKFTGKQPLAHIELGKIEQEGKTTYYIRDNGAGFDMTYQEKLFQAFQRLHTPQEFPGTGIGLATVQRIVRRHGGKIWAQAIVNHGASFYFTL